MRVHILPKRIFDAAMIRQGITSDTVEERTSMFFISINDTDGGESPPYFPDDKKNVKVIYLDDIDKDVVIPIIGGGSRTCKAMSYEQAQELYDFIASHSDKKSCVVHCAAGISRSGAVGTFVHDYYQGDYEVFKRDNPHIFPNSHILSLLHRVWRERQ